MFLMGFSPVPDLKSIFLGDDKRFRSEPNRMRQTKQQVWQQQSNLVIS